MFCVIHYVSLIHKVMILQQQPTRQLYRSTTHTHTANVNLMLLKDLVRLTLHDKREEGDDRTLQVVLIYP